MHFSGLNLGRSEAKKTPFRIFLSDSETGVVSLQPTTVTRGDVDNPKIMGQPFQSLLGIITQVGLFSRFKT